MKKFFMKIFIMFILPTLGIVIILMMTPLPEYSYNFVIIDKHRILASTKSPKIVLAGGSNLAFGIDSAVIQNEFNLPTVNMGLNAGIGLGRILDDISPFLNSGDILLVIPEYEFFTMAWNGGEGAYELIFDMRQYHLLWASHYGLPQDFLGYLSTHLQVIIKKITNTSNPAAYSRDGFNEYGDYINHLGMENPPFVSSEVTGTFNQAYLNRFFQCVDDFSMRGITVALSYPGYEEQSYRNSAGLIQKLDAAFRAKENLLVISSPESYCFPSDCFFDTNYHLNREGRSMRTSQLKQDLQANGLFNIRLP